MAKTILAVGEVLWDVYDDGPRFGGAPANFACACGELGDGWVRVFMGSAVGRDRLGDDAQRQLVARGVEVSHVAVTDRPTGQVVVKHDEQKKATYRFIDNPAWDHIPLTPEFLATARIADVLCFGTLGQWADTSRETIRAVARAANPNAVRILDINLRPPFWTPEIVRDSLPLANVLKLNDEELPILAGVLGLDAAPEAFLSAVLERYSLRLVALTRGANGAVLLAADGERSDLPGAPVAVVDTVGAGDAFTAALALGLSQGWPLDRINRRASEVAAYVCTQRGATPAYPRQFRLSE